MVDVKTGKLEPEKKWKEIFSDDFNETKLREKITYNTPPDKDGNSQKQEVWVASKEAINDLFYKKNQSIIALDLQNQRNMAIAMQGDSQSIERSQLETLQMLNMQISGLNQSINALGNITNEFLKNHLDDIESTLDETSMQGKEINYQKVENDFTKEFIDNLNNSGFGKFEDTLEYNKAGRLKFKDTKKDSTGIESL